MRLCVHICSWVGRCTCVYVSTYTNVCKTRGQLPVLFFMNTLSGDRSLTELALTVLTGMAGLHAFGATCLRFPSPGVKSMHHYAQNFYVALGFKDRASCLLWQAFHQLSQVCLLGHQWWSHQLGHLNLIVHCKLQAGTEVFHSRTFCRMPNPMIPARWHGYWTDLWASVPQATFP